MFSNRLNTTFSPWAWIENTVFRVETHWLSGEEVPGAVIIKEGHADSIRGHERVCSIDLLKKGARVPIANSLGNVSFLLLNGPRVCVCVYAD